VVTNLLVIIFRRRVRIALYQGTTLVVPEIIETTTGFSPEVRLFCPGHGLFRSLLENIHDFPKVIS